MLRNVRLICSQTDVSMELVRACGFEATAAASVVSISEWLYHHRQKASMPGKRYMPCVVGLHKRIVFVPTQNSSWLRIIHSLSALCFLSPLAMTPQCETHTFALCSCFHCRCGRGHSKRIAIEHNKSYSILSQRNALHSSSHNQRHRKWYALARCCCTCR